MKQMNPIGGILIMLMLFACSESEELTMPVFNEYKPSGVLDTWLYENYTQPYQIVVQYKWDPLELPFDKILVPPHEDKVIPVMSAIKDTWITPYVSVSSVDFIRKHAPKQFILSGSALFNNDGTIVLGQAESGLKVVLYLINEFESNDVDGVKNMLHTIHHEFGHILHQSKLYPREYKQITPGGYTAAWYNTSSSAALDLGFITPYARSNANDDFVEMIATMLVEGKSGYEMILDGASDTGRQSLRKKEALIVSYFKQAWNIDFYELQESTTQAIDQLTGG